METGPAFLLLTVAASALASFAVFVVCFWWFRREQQRVQRRMLHTVIHAARQADEPVITPAAIPGELVAQFKVRQGKQVVSVFEADGRRFIHVDGELSGAERARMVRYLKSEGFMS
jgi:hypothetical protein